MKICVIACKVLNRDLKLAAKKVGINADFEFLPFGLHNTPAQLVAEVQKFIDKAAASNQYSKIVLGYGICGKGTNGLKATLPLVIPQAHDCVTLFLGSIKAYNEQFAKCPGTYYFTKGWFDENPNYETTLRIGLNIETPGKTYTQDELDVLKEFLAGWQKHYARALFVRASQNDDDEKYRQIAKKIAKEYDWNYEELIGTTELFEKLLTTQTSDNEVLIVPQGRTLVFDEVASKLVISKE